MMARQIATKRTVTFAYKAPEAQTVSLAGNFTNWAQAQVSLSKRARITCSFYLDVVQ